MVLRYFGELIWLLPDLLECGEVRVFAIKVRIGTNQVRGSSRKPGRCRGRGPTIPAAAKFPDSSATGSMPLFKSAYFATAIGVGEFFSQAIRSAFDRL